MSVMAFFKRSTFLLKKEINKQNSQEASAHLKSQLKHSATRALIKVRRLDSARDGTALMGGQNSDAGRAQNEKLRTKGGWWWDGVGGGDHHSIVGI